MSNNDLTKAQAQEIVRRSRELNRSMNDEERQALLDRVRRGGEEMTEEEDRAITQDALADSDNPPADEWLARRGRPPLENPKQAIKLRLDADLVAALRHSGRGWQTRANAMLRKAMGLK